MNDKATDLITRLEQETNCRVDDNGFDNPAIAGLFGAIARELGQSQHRKHDDVAAGYVIKHRMTPEYHQKAQADALLATLLSSGISPDEMKTLIQDD